MASLNPTRGSIVKRYISPIMANIKKIIHHLIRLIVNESIIPDIIIMSTINSMKKILLESLTHVINELEIAKNITIKP